MTKRIMAERCASARAAQRISQKELAARAGVTQSAIAKVENGKSRSTRHLIEIAAALGVNPLWLKGVSDEQDATRRTTIVTASENAIDKDPVGRGKRITARRTDLSLSQADLATAAGCSQQLIASLERGSIRWSRAIAKIAKALDTTVEWIETGYDPPNLITVADISEREKSLIMAFRLADEDRRRRIEASLADQQDEPPGT